MDRETSTAWIDMQLLILVVFIVLAVLFKSVEAAKHTDEAVQQGNLTVQMFWPNENKSDVDLWVKAPGDRAVGYSSKNGLIFDLLRDDLGSVNDVTEINQEIAYTRGLPEGEYIINVHLFHNILQGPIPVKVIGQIRQPGNQSMVTAFVKQVTLDYEGQEITVIRFTIDKAYRVLDENTIPIKLRAGS